VKMVVIGEDSVNPTCVDLYLKWYAGGIGHLNIFSTNGGALQNI